MNVPGHESYIKNSEKCCHLNVSKCSQIWMSTSILKFDFIFTHCWYDKKKGLASDKIFSQRGSNVFLIHKVGKPKKQKWLIRNPGCLFLSFDVHQPHLILFLFVRYWAAVCSVCQNEIAVSWVQSAAHEWADLLLLDIFYDDMQGYVYLYVKLVIVYSTYTKKD